MSSGFVSGGTIDVPTERDDEWRAAQKEIEDLRRKKAEESKRNDGRSLFEILEANKAAKQDAFEEANKLKNQFRSLDEDEIDFLDSVMEKTRREEERVKKETKEGLEAFRRQQQLADKKLTADTGNEEIQEEWLAGPRKRKRTKEKEGLKGVKLRKSSTNDAKEKTSTRVLERKESPAPTKSSTPSKLEADKVEPETISPVKSESDPNTGRLGLVNYGSDDDDD